MIDNQLNVHRKPLDIVDRDAQWRELETVWQHKGPDLVFGMGRRRAGKSWVLARFAGAVGGIYYQATNRTKADQIAALSRIIGTHFADALLAGGTAFRGWEELFGYLQDKAASAPLLLVLDEFPYLAAASPALTSIIQKAWDHDWPSTQLKIVLHGSHTTAMTQFEQRGQPLFGRRTAQLDFPPSTHEFVAAFVPNYAPRDQLRVASIFGGLPGHLALLDPARSLAENVARQMLTPAGRLRDEAQHMLDAFRKDAQIPYSILDAIANGEQTWSRISNRLGLKSGDLSRPMRWLEEMHFVTRTVPITEPLAGTSKKSRYAISDAYVSFWHRFVAPLSRAGEIGLVPPAQLWAEHIAPRLEDYMGPHFERLCRSWVQRSPKMPWRPSRVGQWWDDASQEEVDVVAFDDHGRVLVGGCKWGEVNDSDLRTLRRRAALLVPHLPLGRRTPKVQLAVFSGQSAFSGGVRAAMAGGEVLGFGAGDVMGVE